MVEVSCACRECGGDGVECVAWAVCELPQLDAVVLNPRREPVWLQPVLVLLSTHHLIGAVGMRARSMLA